MEAISILNYQPISQNDYIFTFIGDWRWMAAIFVFTLTIIYFVVRLLKSKR